MYISNISLKGYKNANEESEIKLQSGLNILLGENGCGKTAVINAIRLILREQESYSALSADDFYCSLDKTQRATEINIDVDFENLNENEKITFLTWCDESFDAHLHLSISENPSRPGHFKRKYWGGHSASSIFEEDTFDKVECIYLPPLRDAESKLSHGRRSRLALLLKKQYGENTESLVNSVKDFNDKITQNDGGKYEEIDTVKKTINTKIKDALGTELGQSINLQFSETTFSKIIENIRMVFFPHSGETNITKFRDLATNSLGYNNLLYIATVFSELELIKDSDVFTVLLIEEPEAHLHPQLQVKFIKYLQSLSETLPNAQIIVSTHSPVLASSVDITRLIHLAEHDNRIISTTVADKTFGDDLSLNYVNRWLDVTKSTMLFSRGIIFVEGIAEALILPELAKIILNTYNTISKAKGKKTIANTLDEMGVSIININGINFKHFMKLFANFDDSSGPNIPIYCSGITDRDPGKDIYPIKGQTPSTENPVKEYIDDINRNTFTRLFMSPLKTLEYDIGIENPMLLANTLKSVWATEKGTIQKELDTIINKAGNYTNDEELANDIKFIYDHIETVGKGVFAHTLSENITDDFVVPEYIKDAVLWACGGIVDYITTEEKSISESAM